MSLDAVSSLVSAKFKSEREAYEIHLPPSPDAWIDAVHTAPEKGCDKLLVVGGDGSLHLSLQAMDFDRLSLGVIPAGSGNDIYRAFGIPATVTAALDNFFAGEEIVDVGEAAGRYFLNTAGCGLDTWTVEIKNQSKGWLARNYLFLFLKIIRALRPLDLEITIDGNTIKRRSYWAIAANNGFIGGGMRITPDADMRDGLLDVLIIGDISKLEMVMRMPKIFKGTHLGHPKIEVIRGRNVVIDSKEPITCALDGELHGTTPLEIKLHHAKLRLHGGFNKPAPAKRT